GPLKELSKNMNINANIVNVYGKAINEGGPGSPGGGKGKGKSGSSGSSGKSTPNTKIPGGNLLGWGKNALRIGIPSLIAGDVASGAMGGPSVTKTIIEKAFDPKTEQKINETHRLIVEQKNSIPKETTLGPGKTGPSNPKDMTNSRNIINQVDYSGFANTMQKIADSITGLFEREKKKEPAYNPLNRNNDFSKFGDGSVLNSTFNRLLQGETERTNAINSSIVSGFQTANERLQNLKVQNQVQVQMPAANITINGNVREHISSVRV